MGRSWSRCAFTLGITIVPGTFGGSGAWPSPRSRWPAAATTIVLTDGTYDLGGKTLQLHTKGVSIRGKSGDREKVIIDSGYSTVAGDGIAISANDCTVADLTIRRAYNHPIHAYPAGSDV